jgi:glycerate kinase
VRRITIPSVVLIAPDRLSPRLSAELSADAIARGLRSQGWECDTCPLADDSPASWRAALERVRFDQRMRSARAVVAGAPLLDRHQLVGSAIAEVATRARQGGVPCYAIVAHDQLEPFDKRILDLEAVLEAATAAQLERAGRELATLLSDQCANA